MFGATRGSAVKLTVAVAVLSAVSGVFVATARFATLWPALLIVSLVLLVAARRRFASVPLSPVWIVVLVFSAMAVAGWAFYGDVQKAPGGAGITLYMTPELSQQTVGLFAVATASVAAGALIGAQIGRPLRRRDRVNPVQMSDRARGRLLAACAVPLLLIIGTDPGGLVERGVYLRGAAGGLSGFGAQVGVVAVLVLGLLIATERGWRLSAAWWLVLLYLAAYLALGSRTFALVPLLLAVGAVATRLRWAWLLPAVGLLSIWLLQVPLALRGLTTHGLRPYLTHLAAALTADDGFATSVKNLLVSFPITGYTAFARPPIPTNHILIELSPLPGGMAGWYEIANQQRLNAFTPYSAIGTLGNAGWMWLIGYCVALGLLLAYLDRRVGRLVATGHTVYAFAIVGMSTLLAVVALQYNLRSATRLILYALILDLLIRWVVRNHSADRRQAVTENRSGMFEVA